MALLIQEMIAALVLQLKKYILFAWQTGIREIYSTISFNGGGI